MSEVEFSRPLRVDTLGPSGRGIEIGAGDGERAALARRFGLPAIHRLSAEAMVSRHGETVTAKGTISAAVTQSCVATGELVEASIDEPFEILFRPQPDADAEEEIELSAAELDVVFYEGASIDLGEAVAETLSLSLDPYPRSPAADEALKAAGVKSEEESGAFGALAALRDKLKP